MRRFQPLALAVLLLSCRHPPPPPPTPLTAEQQAELAKVVDEAWASAQKADAEARDAAIAAESAKAKPGGGPCPIRYPQLEALEINPLALGPGAVVEVKKETLLILPSGQFGDGPAASAISTPKDLWKMRLEKPVTDRMGFDELLASVRRELALKPAGTLVLVATEYAEPRGAGKDEFTPGRIRGTLYAYDPSQKRVVCAAPVDATNGGAARTYRRGDPSAGLMLDLLGHAVLGSFRRLAPLAPAGGGG